MKPTFNDKLIAYFTLFSGFAISGIAEYYSIMGLMAIYPTAIIPIIIMGVVLGIGKISGTVWLKQNWDWSPFFLKAYVLPAIIVLMLITSLGVFGFLSKAHSDQTLVSGDVQSKIAIYDEKIKTAKENIEADRKQLKQMDEAFDQVMGRSSDEKGADKANAIRKSQLRDRVALAKDIEANQKLIASLNEEAAPIRAEVRKVEAEVGPIKYIAHLLYGANPDANVLEKAVIWVTVLIVIVLDPLAVVLLLASQYSFQRFKELETEESETNIYVADVGEKPTAEELREIEEFNQALETKQAVARALDESAPLPVPKEDIKIIEESGISNIVDDTLNVISQSTSTVEYQFIEEITGEEPVVDTQAYLKQPFVHFSNLTPMPAPKIEQDDSPNFEGIKDTSTGEWIQTGPSFDVPSQKDPYDDKGIDWDNIPPEQEYITVDGARMHVKAARDLHGPKHIRTTDTYVQNEEQSESGLWNKVITEQEYRDKITERKNESTYNPNNPT